MNESPSTELIIIGTIHGGHSKAKHYTEQALKDIIVGLRPDAICVELYSKHFNPDGTLTDDVLAMCGQYPDVRAVNDAATELGVRQIPFEREGRDELFVETNYFEREAKASGQTSEFIKKLQAEAPDSNAHQLICAVVAASESQSELTSRATADIINSHALDAVIWIKHKLSHHVLPEAVRGYPEMQEAAEFWEFTGREWDERNSIMADNLGRIAADFPGGRLAVITGCEHRYILRELLADKPGIVLKEYWEVLHKTA